MGRSRSSGRLHPWGGRHLTSNDHALIGTVTLDGGLCTGSFAAPVTREGPRTGFRLRRLEIGKPLSMPRHRAHLTCLTSCTVPG